MKLKINYQTLINIINIKYNIFDQLKSFSKKILFSY